MELDQVVKVVVPATSQWGEQLGITTHYKSAVCTTQFHAPLDLFIMSQSAVTTLKIFHFDSQEENVKI